MEVDNTAPEYLDLVVQNVFVTFIVDCKLNLLQIARTVSNVEYQNGKNDLVMRIRNPRCTARISSSGKVRMVGASSEEEAKRGARRLARIIQKLGFIVKFKNYQIRNVIATCILPFGIRMFRIKNFAAPFKPAFIPLATCDWQTGKYPLKFILAEECWFWAPVSKIFCEQWSVSSSCSMSSRRKEPSIEFESELKGKNEKKSTAKKGNNIKKNQKRKATSYNNNEFSNKYMD